MGEQYRSNNGSEGMNCYGYTRAENETEASRIRLVMRGWCQENRHELKSFRWDGLAGQRALHTTLKEVGPETILIVWRLSDFAHDVTNAIKIIVGLLTADISIQALSTRLWFTKGSVEASVIAALWRAHEHYVSVNRKQGQEQARAAGATIGRPTLFKLDGTRAIIERLIKESEARPATKTRAGARKAKKSLKNGKASHYPSARQLAKATGCGATKALNLLQQYKAEQAAQENGGENG